MSWILWITSDKIMGWRSHFCHSNKLVMCSCEVPLQSHQTFAMNCNCSLLNTGIVDLPLPWSLCLCYCANECDSKTATRCAHTVILPQNLFLSTMVDYVTKYHMYANKVLQAYLKHIHKLQTFMTALNGYLNLLFNLCYITNGSLKTWGTVCLAEHTWCISGVLEPPQVSCRSTLQ